MAENEPLPQPKIVLDDLITGLAGLSVEDLDRLIRAAEAKRREKQEEARRLLREEFREKAAAHGLSVEDIIRPDPPKSNQSSRKVPIQFRGPRGEEWSGRGKDPNWLTALEAEGHSRDEYRV